MGYELFSKGTIEKITLNGVEIGKGELISIKTIKTPILRKIKQFFFKIFRKVKGSISFNLVKKKTKLITIDEMISRDRPNKYTTKTEFFLIAQLSKKIIENAMLSVQIEMLKSQPRPDFADGGIIL